MTFGITATPVTTSAGGNVQFQGGSITHEPKSDSTKTLIVAGVVVSGIFALYVIARHYKLL